MTAAQDAALRFGRFELRPATRVLLVDGAPAHLGARAFDVLQVLVEARGRTVSRSELFDRVWTGRVVEDQNLRVQINTLRRVLGPEAITTLPGRGYRFTWRDEPVTGTAASQAAATDATAGATAGAGAGTTASVAAGADSAPVAPSASNGGGAAHAPLPPLPALFGRVGDIAAVYRLVEAHGVVTIAGPGGIGKTRLAQAVAHQLQPQYGERIWLVELAALADETTVVPTVARALGFSPDRGLHSPAALAGALAPLHGLLVLDNAEHLVGAVAALVAAVRRAAPQLAVLVTSQEPLRIEAEHVYRLDPLALPADTEPLAEASAAGAVALFVGRVQAQLPRFALDADNRAAVVDICRRLDGIPLALELAAARVPLLGVEGVRARLDERLQLLTTGRRDLPARQQTLRGALAWSHQLLSDDEQVVFRRLGVFAGSFGLALLQQVLGDGGDDDWAVLDHLGSLSDKSLVRVEGDDPPRYRLLESTRAFALERLAAAGEDDALRERHARALALAWREHELEGLAQPVLVWQARHLPDLDNLRAALAWSCALPARRELAAALLARTTRFWLGLGLTAEPRRWALALQPHLADAPPGPAADDLAIALAMLALYAAEGIEPEPALQRLGEVIERLAADSMRQFLLLHVSYALHLRVAPRGDRSAVLARMRALERPDWPPLLKRYRRMDEAQEDYLAGRTEAYLAFCREDCALCHRLHAVAESWISARHVLLAEYQADRPQRALEVGADLFDKVRATGRLRQNDVTVAIWTWMVAEHGDVATARTALADLLPVLRGDRTVWRVGLTLAWVAWHEQRAAAAAQLLGWYDAQVQAVGQGVHGPASERSRQRLLARLAEALDASALASERAAGAALDGRAAVARALDAIDAP